MTSEEAFTLHVSLDGCQPQIWRRLLVRGRSTLHDLHRAIQVSLGWRDSHIYEFRIGDDRYTALEALDEDDGSKDARRMTLARAVASSGGRWKYLYDFGDRWFHTIEFVGSEPTRAGQFYPRCLAGERACPPEDCGGVDGYFEFLAALLSSPRQEEHDAVQGWVGGNFDPESFDLEAVNRQLAARRRRPVPTG